jgi:CheY-like chemotaxis protein
MPQSPSVLIVEPSADEREVLRTVLARRGLQIFEAAGIEAGLALARAHHPRVIVLDNSAGDNATEQRFASEGDASLIILGRARRDEIAAGDSPGPQIVAKPYHYAPLIHKIEQLAKAA